MCNFNYTQVRMKLLAIHLRCLLYELRGVHQLGASCRESALQKGQSAGGGFIGAHAATDTEPGWQWYRDLVGAHVHSPPAIQSAQFHVDVADHLATAHLSDPWRPALEPRLRSRS